MPTPQPAPDTALPALTLEELTQPTSEQRARLLDLAKRVTKAKPWKQLEEDEIFVVRNPTDDTLLFVGAIGGAGEQAGVIIYRGTEAYFGLLDFLDRASQMPALPQIGESVKDPEEMMALLTEALSEANFNPMELMQLPQLQLMFEPRAQLEAPDKAWIKDHSYKATGSGFPTFRGVSSGFLPWWISDEEADIMLVAIEQLLDVVERDDDASDLIEISESDDDTGLDMFARVPATAKDGAVTWSDQRLVIAPRRETLRLELAPDGEQVEQILALPASREVVEVALLSLPVPVGDAETRPFFPTVLLLGHNGQVAGMETLPCGFGYALMPQIVHALVKSLSERTKRPKTLQFSSPDLEILNSVGQKLGIAVEEVEELPTLDAAIESLMEHMENVNLDDLEEEDFEALQSNQPPKFLH